MQPCSPELIHHCLDRWRIFREMLDDVRSNSQRSIVTALPPINAELFGKSENVLPRHTEHVANSLISVCRIGKHRAEPKERSLAVMEIKTGGIYHLLDGFLTNPVTYCAAKEGLKQTDLAKHGGVIPVNPFTGYLVAPELHDHYKIDSNLFVRRRDFRQKPGHRLVVAECHIQFIDKLSIADHTVHGCRI
jgi:hypothetical protein